MTPEDRDLLQRLRTEEAELRQALSDLGQRLSALEARAHANGAALLPELPPIPVEAESTFAPSAAFIGHETLPPILPEIPPAELPPIPALAPKPTMEFRISRWLPRLGALFFVLFLITVDSVWHLHRYLGLTGQLALMGAVSIFLVAVGRRLNRREMPIYGRTLMAAGLGGFYVTLYAATALPPWQLVTNPVSGGLILLCWSIYVFDLARRMASQPMALLALALAYVTTALNPMTRFSLGADLLLAGTSVLFLMRFSWLALAYVSLAGTYVAVGHRLFFNEQNEFVFDTSRALAFAPHAVYLIAAWGAYTVGVLFAPALTKSARTTLLTVNNALGAGLLVLSALICGYGSDRAGGVLLIAGLGSLGVSAIARGVRPETSASYAAQGLALATGGIMTIFSGAGRAALLVVETLVLAIGGVIARNRILANTAWVVAFFATAFVLWNVTVEALYPWLLGLGGTAVMLKCAWLTRQRQRAPHFAWPATLYSALGLFILGTLLDTQMRAGTLPPALAFIALGATLLGFALKLGEIQPIAQLLLLAAQFFALYPTENGEEISTWSGVWVSIATLGMMTALRGTWLRLCNPFYALALVGLLDHFVRPHVNDQSWMVDASALAFLFLIIGAATRLWSLAAAGQLFLLAAVLHFFKSVQAVPWSAAIPLAVVFATGRALHGWLRTFPDILGRPRQILRTNAFFYQLLALVMLVDALVTILPPPALPAMFLLIGTLMLAINTLRLKPFGIRCSFVMSGLGALLIWFVPGHPLVTLVSSLAVLLFLIQPTILGHAARPLCTTLESWGLVLVSAVTGWVFVAGPAHARWGNGAITASWALYALLLFLIGFALDQKRQRWCGLAILLAAILRMFIVDFWSMTGGFRVLTFLVLTIVTLGLGFLYARNAERLKTLL